MLPSHNSQFGQDEYLDQTIFNNKRFGFFVDVGAYDGVTLSNTLFFEKHRQWKGICIEPLPHAYEKLVQQRPSAIHIQGCAYNTNDFITFQRIHGPEMLSGIVDTYHEKHNHRIAQEIRDSQGSFENITVPCFTLEYILDKHNIKHVDYMSIDTEGSELQVIQGINFNKVTIDVIDVENNYNETHVKQYLEQHGYRLHHKLNIDDIYVRKDL